MALPRAPLPGLAPHSSPTPEGASATDVPQTGIRAARRGRGSIVSNITSSSFSRRDLVRGGAIGAAGLGLVTAVNTASAAPSSSADGETGAGFTFADTIAWDACYDVMVLGIGFAGMASAMTAADEGASVLICEKAPKGEAGGNSRVCGQMFVNGHGDADSTFEYFKALSAGRDVSDEMLRTFTDKVAVSDQVISQDFGMPADDLVDQGVTPMAPQLAMFTPEYPEMPGSSVVSVFTAHMGASDSYLYKAMRSRIEDSYSDKIDVWFETPGEHLIQDPDTKTIVGVQVQRDGQTRNVRALNGVCLCCGGFENNPTMVKNYLNVVNHAVIGGLYNTGDGITMAQEVGARLWHMSIFEGGCAYLGLSYNVPDGKNAIQVLPIGQAPFNLGAAIVVGDGGQRFGNESYNARHGHIPVGNGLWDNPDYPNHVFAVWDQTNMDQLDQLGLINADYVDSVIACADIAEAAAAIGCDEATLQTTIDNYNAFATNGVDYEFGRDPQTMAPFDGVAYYVMPEKAEVLNTQGGPERNENAEVLDVDGNPIPHLYSAGELGGITSCMYQGATNVAECFIFGQIAGRGAAAAKDELPAYRAATKVSSNPATVGAETDLGGSSEEAFSDLPDGAKIGVGQGIGGDVPVAVTLNADGTIASVTVGENSETDGIGSKAIAAMPEEFVGLSTLDQIQGVDGVSGASVTSQALRDAVAQALGLE